MEDGKNGKTGSEPVALEQQKPIEAQILGQFIKDLSFENPSMGRVVLAPGENPNIKVEVNVEARRTGTDLYESGIDFKAVASHKDSTIYDLELVYLGRVPPAKYSRTGARAVPAHQLPGAHLPVCAPPGGRHHPRGRLPATFARSDRLRAAFPSPPAGGGNVQSSELKLLCGAADSRRA